jgi:nucleotide-binding universal stress UspA family protein
MLVDIALADPALAGVRAEAHLVNDTPARSLLEHADGAGMLVIGSRGLGRVASTLLGSVSRQVLHHARCPVVVIT